ncbi:MAG: restriction endonuclease subunit S [Halobacteriota archaeon]
MESNWPAVKLKELLEQNTTTEKLEPEESYRLLGVRLEGKGPFIREEKPGSQVRAKSLRKVTSGEFIYSRLFAWRGAFGLISPEMDCAFVSNEFPTFKIDEQQVFPKFLEIYFKQRWVWNEVEKYCTGTTKASRNRFKEKIFLDLDILLPAKEEQKHIVAKIESLLARIEEAKRLRDEAIGEVAETVVAFKEKIFSDLVKYPKQIITDVAPEDAILVDCSNKNFSNLLYISLGNVESDTGNLVNLNIAEEMGILGKAALFNQKHVLYSKLRPYLNKVVLPYFEGCGTTEFVVLKPDDRIITREFLVEYLRNPLFVKVATENSSGTKMPRTNMRWFRNIEIPLPPISEQCRIVAYLDLLQAKVDELKRLQAETEKELEELVPSIFDKAFKGEL